VSHNAALDSPDQGFEMDWQILGIPAGTRVTRSSPAAEVTVEITIGEATDCSFQNYLNERNSARSKTARAEVKRKKNVRSVVTVASPPAESVAIDPRHDLPDR
jgi:hypothetical protein